jgi:hypothetical protein
VEDLTRIDIIGYQGEYALSGSFVRDPSTTDIRPVIHGSGASAVPARSDRVSGFAEALLSTDDMRLVTTSASRHEELGVRQVSGPESLRPDEFVLNLWSDDGSSSTVYLGVSSNVEVVYLRRAHSDSVYATADTFSRALSLNLDWFVDFRLLQGQVRRSDVESVRFSGLVEAQIVRLDSGFTADYEPGGAAEAAAATSVSRLLSLEGSGFLAETVGVDEVIMRADVVLENTDTLVVLFGAEQEEGYPVTVLWPHRDTGIATEYRQGVMVFDHLIDELILSLSTLQPS